jgi:hypothetical protein
MLYALLHLWLWACLLMVPVVAVLAFVNATSRKRPAAPPAPLRRTPEEQREFARWVRSLGLPADSINRPQ